MIESLLTSLVANILTSHALFVFVIVLLGYMYCFWSVWVAVNIAHTRIHRFVYAVLMWVLILVGGVLDVFFQCTFAWILFLERPRETTLSMRLTRYLHLYGPYGQKPETLVEKWRLKAAVWLATNLIEPWSPGHIGLARLGFAPARDAISPLLKHFPNPLEQFALIGALLASAVSVGASVYLIL